MEEEEPRSPACACEACGGAIVWESLVEGEEERWLGLCRECGAMIAFLPDRPRLRPRDPLRVFLLGVGRPSQRETPPWIRFYRLTGGPPWQVEWVHNQNACAVCEARVLFQTRGYPRPRVEARCVLCLQCGYTWVEHVHAGGTLRELPVAGGEWTPPCPAVLRLRDAVLCPYRHTQRQPGEAEAD